MLLNQKDLEVNKPITLDVPASAAYPVWIIVDVISPEEAKVVDVPK